MQETDVRWVKTKHNFLIRLITEWNGWPYLPKLKPQPWMAYPRVAQTKWTRYIKVLIWHCCCCKYPYMELWWDCCNMGCPPPKLISNSNLAKSRSSWTFISVVELFWNFAQSTAVILPCSVRNFWKRFYKWDMRYGQTRFHRIWF